MRAVCRAYKHERSTTATTRATKNRSALVAIKCYTGKLNKTHVCTHTHGDLNVYTK